MRNLSPKVAIGGADDVAFRRSRETPVRALNPWQVERGRLGRSERRNLVNRRSSDLVRVPAAATTRNVATEEHFDESGALVGRPASNASIAAVSRWMRRYLRRLRARRRAPHATAGAASMRSTRRRSRAARRSTRTTQGPIEPPARRITPSDARAARDRGAP
jgi:hypothetical protein